jgi:acetyl-CoA carboxylase biotin carboxyl carrier protein
MTMRRRRARGDADEVSELARRLGALLAELNLSEIEVATGDLRVRLQRAREGSALPAAPGAATAAGADVSARLIPIESPMVGTFYRAASPTSDAYVREGDSVKPGQILCIIEAMKLMNEIESKLSGRIHTILVENGQGVEYGQPLFLLDPPR